MSEFNKLTPEQVKEIKTINELRDAVKSEIDYIGLMGYQPSLVKIRAAYKDKTINEAELELVLKALYDKTGGEPETFKSVKHFWHEYLAGEKFEKKNTPKLNIFEQKEAINSIIGDELKKSNKPKSKPKQKTITIDKSLLPLELQKFAK